jgi:hypothetical protein
MAYAIMQTDTATTRGSASGSVWTIVAFFVAFVGETLVTVGIPGWMFSRFSGGDDEDDDFRTSPSEALAHAVPKTRGGWGATPRRTSRRRSERSELSSGTEARAQHLGLLKIVWGPCCRELSRPR